MTRREDRLNVLILLSDQHGPHLLGCCGNDLVRTPSLDRLAGEGMRFTNTYCPSPLCVPSRMSFMTSRMPTRNRVWNNHHALSSGIPTWAHVAGAAGFETALIGRMHFVGADQRHGFEKRPIGEFMARHPGTPYVGGPAWRKYPGSTTGQSRECVEIAGRGRTAYQIMDEQAADATCDYLRAKAAERDGRPFAAVAGFLLPHCPFIGPKELFDHYYERVDVPPVEERQPATVTRFRRVRGIVDPPLDDERIRVARAAYFAVCEFFDGLVGRILDALDETGLADNTLVIYTSDHGECAGEHGCWWKSNYYESSVKVPTIARLPDVVPAGSVEECVCSLVDIGPTVCEIAGAPFERVDGRSLWPTLRGEHPSGWVDETFSEFVDERGGPPLASRMIRSGPWKLWFYADDERLPPALFNLDDDPDELNDLGADPNFAEVRERLLARLMQDWDPADAARSTVEQTEDNRFISRWGAAISPPCEDALPFPPPEAEDVELV